MEHDYFPKCSKHPTYKAKRPPRGGCDACWHKFFLVINELNIEDRLTTYEKVILDMCDGNIDYRVLPALRYLTAGLYPNNNLWVASDELMEMD